MLDLNLFNKQILSTNKLLISFPELRLDLKQVKFTISIILNFCIRNVSQTQMSQEVENELQGCILCRPLRKGYRNSICPENVHFKLRWCHHMQD